LQHAQADNDSRWRHRSASASPSRTSPEEKEKFTVVYLVRSFGLMPESVSHDWHVQPSCQRPNRGPPKRCEFSPGEPAQVRIRLSSKPYKHTARRKSRQTTHPTGFPDVFHTWTDSGSGGRESCTKLKSRFLTGLSAQFRNHKAFGGRSRLHATV
jgi:hypothetical protein